MPGSKFLLKHQSMFVQAPNLFPEKRVFMIVAGYGSGKTSSIVAGIESAIAEVQGKTDVEGHSPCIMVGGASISHLEKTALAMLKEDLDRSNTPYTVNTKFNYIMVGNVRIVIVSLSDPPSITGFNAWRSFLDEIDDLGVVSDSTDITFEAWRAANERTRQKIPGMRKASVLLGSTSQGQKGLYRIYTQFIKGGQGFVLIRGATMDNPYLDEDYVQSLYKNYNDVERKVYLEGYFLPTSQGRVMPDFDWAKNYIDDDIDTDVGQDEVVYWAQDFNTGYFRGSAFIERGGKILCLKSYDFPEISHGPSVVRHDFPHNKIIFLPDATAKDQIIHFIKELRRYGIYWALRRKNPLVEDTVFLVNKLLYTRRLLFGKMAKDSAEACALAQRDKNGKVPKGIGPNSPIHHIDAVRMACFFMASTLPALTDIKKITIGRHIAITEDREEKIKQLEGGYIQINPSSL